MPALIPPSQKSFDIITEGTCLIVGPTEVALSAAEKLAEALSVTVLLAPGAEMIPTQSYDTVVGTLHQATGTLGRFEVRINEFQQSVSAGAAHLRLTPARDGALSHCDIILDLTGGVPLFPAPEKRDGYLRADPKSQGAVADAIFAASQLVGTFEKPLYVRMETAFAPIRAQKSLRVQIA